METGATERNFFTEVDQANQKPTFWKWYFGWHPRILLTVPLFLLFTYQGLWFIWTEIGDIIFFFQNKPVTWGAVLLILLFGSILIWFFILPIYICFGSLNWLYEIITTKHTAWRKFLYSTGIILLVFFGTSIIRIFTIWVLDLI